MGYLEIMSTIVIMFDLFKSSLISRPEDHISKEQQTFQDGYVKRLRQKLKFRPHINTRVRKILKKIAKKMGKKTKGEVDAH